MAATNSFVRWYRNRIAEPSTTDEALGYWVFVVGVVAGILGVLLFLAGRPASSLREVGIVLSSSGLVLLMVGPIIRLPLRRRATTLAYVGAVIAGLAVIWFVAAFPANWSPTSGQPSIVGLYALGLGVIAVGGVFVPVLTAGPEPDPETARLESELDVLEGSLADAELDEADLADQLRRLRTSQARFELYRDRGDEWRWRLRHRNGQVIATGGEGYTQRHNAQNGLESVRRNALGATVLVHEDEAELPAAEPFEPFAAVDSRASFELYEDAGGEFRWRLVHQNGNVLADGGEGYATRDGVRRALEGIRTYVGPAEYLRVDPTAFEVYRDRAGEWRWRLVHRNGNVLADGGEGYVRRSDAHAAIERIREDDGELTYEVYEDAAGEHRWRLRAPNDELVADGGEGYASRSGADDAVDRVRSYAPEAHVLDVGRAAFELYEDEDGASRWRLRHRNGNVLADGGQGYNDRSAARDGIESVKRNAPGAETRES